MSHVRDTFRSSPIRSLSAALAIAALVCLAAGEARATFSIAAYDSTTGEVGVAVQSRVFGVGPRVAWVMGGGGAIATQANSNETFGPNGLRMLAAGLDAEGTLAWLLQADDGRESRQVGIVDARGGVASWTGGQCSNWAGHSAGVSFTCQGNILTGADVVDDMVRAFRESEGQELAPRMIAALRAGQAAGGDSRGRQSACVLVARPHPDFPEYSERYVDVRVDDHATPIEELARLYRMYEGQGLVQAHMRFAQLFEARGDAAAAAREKRRVGESLERVLADGGASAGTLNGLAWYTATNDIFLDRSLEAAQLAAQLEPGDSNILDTLAECYFRMGKHGEAIEAMKRALAIAPGDPYLTSQLVKFEDARRR